MAELTSIFQNTFLQAHLKAVKALAQTRLLKELANRQSSK